MLRIQYVLSSNLGVGICSGYWEFPRVKIVGRMADQWPPSNVEKKIYFQFPIRLHGVVLN
jgi:hypothetical protein